MITIKLNEELAAKVSLKSFRLQEAMLDKPIYGTTSLANNLDYIYDEEYVALGLNKLDPNTATFKLYWAVFQEPNTTESTKYGLPGRIRQCILQHKEVSKFYRQVIVKVRQKKFETIHELYEKLEPGFKQRYGLVEVK